MPRSNPSREAIIMSKAQNVIIIFVKAQKLFEVVTGCFLHILVLWAIFWNNLGWRAPVTQLVVFMYAFLFFTALSILVLLARVFFLVKYKHRFFTIENVALIARMSFFLLVGLFILGLILMYR
jgi:hypothetical protein